MNQDNFKENREDMNSAGGGALGSQTEYNKTNQLLLSEKSKLLELEQENRELQEQIKNLKSRKKFGLVWEDKPEKVQKKCETKIPILNEVKNKKLENGSEKQPTHLLIEGDNYHTLSVLNYTHANKVNVIYIDPPYNTGNKDFIYNDCFVDKEDGFRHSKWLSFMEKRLKLARNLLTDDGVIFISIDDNEQANLKLLCDEIFGERNFVDCITWNKKSSAKGVPPKNMLVNVHEYILCYQKSLKFSFIGELRSEESFSNPDRDPRGPWRNTNIKSTVKPKNEAFIIIDPKTGSKYKDTWAYSKIELEKLIKQGVLIFPKNKNGQVRRKEYYKEMPNINMAVKSFFGDFDNQSNTEMLKNMLPNQLFLNPKPLNLIKYLFKVTAKSSSVFLDFFAGSGTTGQAVLELNKEDGGNRQFILATNNENGIAENITYQRLKTVITGIRSDGSKYSDGIPSNLSYFKTDFIEKGKNELIDDGTRINLTYHAGAMIAMKENTFNELEKNDFWQIFTNGNRATAIYFNEDKSELVKLIKKIEDKKTSLYIFGWSKNESLEYQTKNIEVKDIPQPIIDIYMEILNRSGMQK
jgi:adenine-specific DNA-methyltransferase